MTSNLSDNSLLKFDVFVGIDWSGAKGLQHRGIAIAICGTDGSAPQAVAPPNGQRAWSRMDVADWLLNISRNKRVFAGIDFAFAHPFIDVGTYYPFDRDIIHTPKTPTDLWQMIDALNQDKPDLYGGGIWNDTNFGPFYNAPGRRGTRFSSRRRRTETLAAAIKSPSPTFNCVGPAGVGTGSLAGMRLLHKLKQEAAIWPFDAPGDDNLVLAEIFPSYYFMMAGLKPIKGAHGEADFLNAALAFFASDPVASSYIATGPDADLSDAMISAAALRHLSRDPACWGRSQAAQYEGWIFGVKDDQRP